jgi:hypothetical protein
LGMVGSQSRAILRRISNPRCASESLPKHVEVIELIGVPGGIRTLVCAVKEPDQWVTDRKYATRVAPKIRECRAL